MELDQREFKQLLGFTKEEYSDLLTRYQASSRFRAPISASCSLLMGMISLRQMPVNLFGGVFFRTSNSVYHANSQKARQFLHETYKVFVCPRVRGEMRRYPHLPGPVQFVLDGSEQPVSSSHDPLQETIFFSAKKKQHSVSAIVIMEPGRWVSHLTKSYPGCITDGSILCDMWNDWSAENLSKGCVALADAGCPGWANIVIPESQPNTRALMKERSDIECLFSCVKVFRACSDRLRLKPANGQLKVLVAHQTAWRTVLGLFNARKCDGNTLEGKFSYISSVSKK